MREKGADIGVYFRIFSSRNNLPVPERPGRGKKVIDKKVETIYLSLVNKDG